MILTQEIIKHIVDEVNSHARRELRLQDFKRWLMFNGKTREIIKEAISKEFSKPETVNELISRLIPLNLTHKIIIKQAGVYVEPPIRMTADRSVQDEELMSNYVEYLSLNQRKKEANRYFKLYKRNLEEIYVDESGCPWLRNLPRHTYEVFSFSKLTPNRPDVVVKIIQDDMDYQKQVLAIWSNESHLIINGKGDVLPEEMIKINNLDGVNPYGALPFVYINESSNSVDPLPDDDLMSMAIAIPVILTDLMFAQKYQSWSLIYTIGYSGQVPSNPNSVIPLDYGPNGERPEIGTVAPSVDADKVLSTVKTLIAMLLSTKNLSVSTVQSQLDAANAASGISKMLDSAESVEDKTDQRAYFEKAEKDLWNLLKDNMIPYWRANGLLKPELNYEFSESFEMDIFFKEPKVMISEMEQIELSKARLDAGFSTLEMELQAIYSQLTKEQIKELANEIELYQSNKKDSQIEEIDGEEPQEEQGQEQDQNVEDVSTGGVTPSGVDVRKETLNGAQIQAVVELVQFVAAGTMPRDAAKNILVVGFNLDDATAEAMLGNAGQGFKIESIKEEKI